MGEIGAKTDYFFDLIASSPLEFVYAEVEPRISGQKTRIYLFPYAFLFLSATLFTFFTGSAQTRFI